MKKVVAFVIFLIVSIVCCGQDSEYGFHAYVSPSVYYLHDGVGVSAGMHLEDEMSSVFMACLSMGLYYSPTLDAACGTYFSYGVKYTPLKYTYILLDLKPIVKINGIGHQVYGDYLTFGVTSGIGAGGYIQIGSSGILYAEAKLCTDIIIYSELGKKGGGSYVFAGIGYRYRIL